MRHRVTPRRVAVAVAILTAITSFARPVWAAGPADPTSTATGSSTTAPTTTSSTMLPPETSSTIPASTTQPGSTTTVPVTVPPAGAPVSNLQLDAITAQFVADVQAEVGAAQDSLDLARSSLATAQAAQTAAAAKLEDDTRRLEQLDAAQRQQVAALTSARARLRDLAVDAYVAGGPGAPIEQLLGSGDINQFARRQGYLATVAAESTDALRGYTKARDASTRAALTTVDDLQRAESAKAVTDAQVQMAQAAVTDATTVLSDRQALLTLTSDAVATPHTDIPRMVLDAYQRAALAVQAKGCHLAWWGLAGIGKVESDHGRDQHAHLAPNGDLVPHIVGVPLTGKNGTVLVQAGGAFAHAEGPMQFIPSTWLAWGEDGNGDGIRDVDNIYDATLGAAMYLCASSLDLETDDGLKVAYRSYNQSDDYVTEVLAYAKSYEAANAAGLIPPMAPIPLWALAPPTPVPVVAGGAPGTAGGTSATSTTTSLP
jgi:membrane-bound lytic murein transglycosylase B